MFNGSTFGFVNGIITMLSLMTGMYATRVNKVGIIGAILAMIISDPLCDAYAIYIAQKENEPGATPDVAIQAFLSQVSLQALFLFIIIMVPQLKYGIYTSYAVGFLGTVYYSYIKSLTIQETTKNMLGIITLIAITYGIDNLVYKYFKK